MNPYAWTTFPYILFFHVISSTRERSNIDCQSCGDANLFSRLPTGGFYCFGAEPCLVLTGCDKSDFQFVGVEFLISSSGAVKLRSMSFVPGCCVGAAVALSIIKSWYPQIPDTIEPVTATWITGLLVAQLATIPLGNFFSTARQIS